MTGRRPISGSKILITGGRGFLGANLGLRLRALGAEVHCISRSRVTAGSGDGIHWVQGDIAGVEFVRQSLSSIQPDVVFHLSGHGVGAPGLENVLPAFRDDLAATVNLLVAVTERRTRDEIDAYVCAYVALYYWWWGTDRCAVMGDAATGAVVTPVDGEARRRMAGG